MYLEVLKALQMILLQAHYFKHCYFYSATFASRLSLEFLLVTIVSFVSEEAFGFNKVTKKLFVTDKIKSFILTILFGGGIVSLLFVIFEALKDNIWTFIFGAYVVIFVVMLGLFLFNGLFVRLFNKLTLLEEGSLKTKLMHLLQN